MAKGRIRSIKPEFWTDGKNLNLSDSCSLFFIGLWNFCDDEGKIELDYGQISAQLGGRWDKGKVKLFTSRLIKTGRLRISYASAWLQVVKWSHQRIDRPNQPNVKAVQIQWFDDYDSWIETERSRAIPAWIGSDSIVSERRGLDETPPLIKDSSNKKKDLKTFSEKEEIDAVRLPDFDNLLSEVAEKDEPLRDKLRELELLGLRVALDFHFLVLRFPNVTDFNSWIGSLCQKTGFTSKADKRGQIDYLVGCLITEINDMKNLIARENKR